MLYWPSKNNRYMQKLGAILLAGQEQTKQRTILALRAAAILVHAPSFSGGKQFPAEARTQLKE
jgi:hypothetical protein